jgi:hypothetical protein
MTAMERPERPWLGETRHVDQTMLARVLNGAARPIFYIAGPPQMVSGCVSFDVCRSPCP